MGCPSQESTAKKIAIEPALGSLNRVSSTLTVVQDEVTGTQAPSAQAKPLSAHDCSVRLRSSAHVLRISSSHQDVPGALAVLVSSGGVVASSGGVVVSSGGVVVSSGGVTPSPGGVVVSPGGVTVSPGGVVVSPGVTVGVLLHAASVKKISEPYLTIVFKPPSSS